jgi:capsular polysaccharide biosynthesis protein
MRSALGATADQVGSVQRVRDERVDRGVSLLHGSLDGGPSSQRAEVSPQRRQEEPQHAERRLRLVEDPWLRVSFRHERKHRARHFTLGQIYTLALGEPRGTHG